jgi:hypothetical protein
MKSKRILLAALLFFTLLIAAIVVGSGLLNVTELANRLPFGPRNVTFQISDRLPSPTPDINGIFVRRENNSIYIGTGNIQFHAKRESDDQPFEFVSSYDGPVVEVLITRDTEILCEVNEIRAPNQKPVNGMIKQIVEPVSDDRIVADTAIWVWGEQQGDRYLARTILIIHQPSNNRCLD